MRAMYSGLRGVYGYGFDTDVLSLWVFLFFSLRSSSLALPRSPRIS